MAHADKAVLPIPTAPAVMNVNPTNASKRMARVALRQQPANVQVAFVVLMVTAVTPLVAVPVKPAVRELAQTYIMAFKAHVVLVTVVGMVVAHKRVLANHV